MPKRTLIDDTIGWVNYIQNTEIKKQPAVIDWESEFRKKDEMYKELARLVAKNHCDYHSLKAKFLRMREECGAEKKRANEAEGRELKIKDVLEDIMYASTYSTDVTFEEIGKAKEIYKSIYGEAL